MPILFQYRTYWWGKAPIQLKIRNIFFQNQPRIEICLVMSSSGLSITQLQVRILEKYRYRHPFQNSDRVGLEKLSTKHKVTKHKVLFLIQYRTNWWSKTSIQLKVYNLFLYNQLWNKICLVVSCSGLSIAQLQI